MSILWGNSIELSNMILTVNEVGTPAGSEFFGPDDGFKFVVLDITLEE